MPVPINTQGCVDMKFIPFVPSHNLLSTLPVVLRVLTDLISTQVLKRAIYRPLQQNVQTQHTDPFCRWDAIVDHAKKSCIEKVFPFTNKRTDKTRIRPHVKLGCDLGGPFQSASQSCSRKESSESETLLADCKWKVLKSLPNDG